MPKPHLYFTIGFPRSGKSSLSKLWQEKKNNIIFNKFVDTEQHISVKFYPDFPRVVITPDSWRLAMGHRYNGYTEPLVFAHVQLAIRAMLLSGYDVLVDDTHTSETSIYRIFEENINAIYVEVNTPEDICIERAHNTHRSDLEPVIRRMAINLAKLKKKYGCLDEVCKVLSHRASVHPGRGVITHE